MAFKFEKLIVWQKSIELNVKIHSVTKWFPKVELYVLSSQIRRAVDSISLNIAEGSTGNSNNEFARFLTKANRSAIEDVCAIHLAKSRNLISNETFQELYDDCTEIIKMIQGLKNSILKN